MSQAIQKMKPFEAPSDLEEWVDRFLKVQTVTRAISQTSWASKEMKSEAACAMAIMAGADLGMKPSQSLASFHVIDGQPTLKARTMLSLVLQAGHEVQVVSVDENEAHVRGRRAGTEHWTEVVWTIERARRMGLTKRPNWQKMPEAMLEARGTSAICRRIAPDALAGMTTSSEEALDTEVTEAEVLSRKPLEQPAPAPAADVEEDFTDEEVAAIAAPKKALVKRGAEPITKNTPPPASPPPAPARQDKSKPASKEAISTIVAEIESQGLADDAAKIEELQRVTGAPDLVSPADMTEAQAIQAAKTLGLMG